MSRFYDFYKTSYADFEISLCLLNGLILHLEQSQQIIKILFSADANSCYCEAVVQKQKQAFFSFVWEKISCSALYFAKVY